MTLTPPRMQINNPAFAIGEKVRAKEAPKACPFREFEVRDHSIFEQILSTPISESSGPTIKQSLKVADPDGWIPHDGGPCPVDGDARVMVRLRGEALRRGDPAEVRPADEWSWKHKLGPWDIVAYKLATPAKEAQPYGEHVTELAYQRQRQRAGLPVEWDKVPVGTPVWVRDLDAQKWTRAYWKEKLQTDFAAGFYRVTHVEGPACTCGWVQCKLFIEGIEP